MTERQQTLTPEAPETVEAAEIQNLSPALKTRLVDKVIQWRGWEYVLSAGAGAALRTAFGCTMPLLGVTGFASTVAVGASAGAAISAGREWWKQRKENQTDTKKILNAAKSGAIKGAFLGPMGGLFADFFIEDILEKYCTTKDDILSSVFTGDIIPIDTDGGVGEITDPFTEQADASSISGTEASGQEALSGSSAAAEISATLSAMPDTIPLTPGSSVWNETAAYLEQALDRPATNAEILEIAKAVCIASNVAEPSWGISGDYLHNQLPVGFQLNFGPPKTLIAQMA